jgi:sugar lactone lactonase YvrE
MNLRSFTFLMVLTTLTANMGWAEERTSIIEPGAKVTKLAGGMGFTEGPVWLPKEKKLIFSDIDNSRLMQWSEEGGLSLYRQSEKANGNILDLQGRIISCQHSGRNVIRIESDGSTTVLADRFEGKRFNSPNDAAVRSDGTLWFTDPPWGLEGPPEIPGHWVYKLDPANGRIEAIIKDLAMPNGIVFSPDETRLYVADTGGDKRNPDTKTHDLRPGIHCYEVKTDGSLGKEIFRTDKGSDGMAVDVRGNVYTTQLDNRVLVIDADGKEFAEIGVPESPANVCFGCDDYKTLFITARTSLYSVRVKYPGAKPKGAQWAEQ